MKRYLINKLFELGAGQLFRHNSFTKNAVCEESLSWKLCLVEILAAYDELIYQTSQNSEILILADSLIRWTNSVFHRFAVKEINQHFHYFYFDIRQFLGRNEPGHSALPLYFSALRKKSSFSSKCELYSIILHSPPFAVKVQRKISSSATFGCW